MNTYFRLLRYLKAYIGFALMNILFNILSLAFNLFSLTMAAPFLNLLFDKQALVKDDPGFSLSANGLINYFNYRLSTVIIENGQLKALMMICILVVIMFFLKNVFKYFANFYMAPIRSGVIKDIRNELYNKIIGLPLKYFSKERKGDLIVRMTSDVQEIQWSIMSSLEVVFREPLTVALFIAVLLFMSPQLTLYVFILLPVSGFLIGRLGRSLKSRARKGQEKMSDMLTLIDETLTGLRIIKGFTAEFFSLKRFQRKNHEYIRVQIHIDRIRDLSAPTSEFLGAIVLVILMYLGGNLVLGEKASLEASVFITYIVLFSQIIQPAKNFTTAYYNIQKGVASAKRVNEILDAEESIREAENPKPIVSFTKNIEYKNVSFRYENDDVLKNINLKIEKGKTIALVGPSGGGKSTLADLLPRFYDVTVGEILIDGIPVKDARVADVRKLMGIVTQESILFNDTVFNNIAFGVENANMDEVIAAAKVANAHDFIMEMPDGYQANIGDRGGKLSGGQRQRISIARAVFKNPPILIMDEATSALDTESERLVQDAITKLMQNRTSLVIAHRLSTIQHADEIIALQKGEIVERGTHTQLLEKQGLYKKLYELQVFD